MRSRTNFAPTARTIIMALVLTVMGLIGTYSGEVNPRAGILCFLLAIGVLLIGMVSKGL